MADTALMIDMIHLLTDGELLLTLQRVYGKLRPGGSLIVRTTVPSDTRFSWKRWIETKRIRMRNCVSHYRTKEDVLAIIAKAGFEATHTEISAPGEEEWWFVATIGSGDKVSL
jgi:hypothetical protein